MTQEFQRAKIAEICGWQEVRVFDKDTVRGYPPDFNPDEQCDEVDFDVPDYLNDLNVMREAEEKLDGYEIQRRYFDELDSILFRDNGGNAESQHFRLIRAKADQRAEAFLKANGNWYKS